ncbi:MAG: acyl-CoA/acyl-ACP dehydrogenase [Gammaproteobacteria bacterium]|nr:acyl-CoA/acyl-ACP dehydrogenase [Gammaproteobacteria bacterium]
MPLTPDQQAIEEAIQRLCEPFDEHYWLARDEDGCFPETFVAALAEGGWLGIAMPQHYGGSGLGITEAAIMMQTIARSGACMSGASAVHMNIFGPNSIVVYGNEEQKKRMLPPLISGDHRACFAVTEPDAGLNTTAITTKAVRCADGYRVSGSKVWTSTAQSATHIMLLTRTTPLAESDRPSDGLTLFYTPLDRTRVEIREIHKMGRHAVDSNQLFIDDLMIPEADRIGEEGKGFHYLLHSLNPERILIGSEAVGVGYAALERATQYARERVVFDRPIGQNQGIQHPLAEGWARLLAANLTVFDAARRYDQGESAGAYANAAKYLGAETAYAVCGQAVLTHGGYGYAREYQVERYLRESLIPRLAPVSQQLVLCYIAEKVLGLPKSY